MASFHAIDVKATGLLFRFEAVGSLLALEFYLFNRGCLDSNSGAACTSAVQQHISERECSMRIFSGGIIVRWTVLCSSNRISLLVPPHTQSFLESRDLVDSKIAWEIRLHTMYSLLIQSLHTPYNLERRTSLRTTY